MIGVECGELTPLETEKQKMNAKIVQCVDGHFVVSVVALDNVIEACSVRGFEVIGYEQSKYVRCELRGKPVFSGLVGPCWDGDCIRYEDQETYNHLST